MINYGVVGTGYFGAELARYLVAENDDANVSVVFDPDNAGEVAEELNCDVADSMEELVQREDVDCVIVASPNYLHRDPVIAAAENGKHVFCEKPIALSYKDCADMVEACKKNGVIFMAGHIMNFFSGVRKAKQMVNDGVIGKVLFCHSARNGWEEEQDSVSWKKIREKSGGHLYHHIHELDCVQFIMGGLPEQATMVAGNVAHEGENFGDEDDMIFVTLEYDDDRYALLEWGSAFRWPEHYLMIQGTEGAIKLDMQNTRGTLRKDGKEEYFLIHDTQEIDDDRTRIYQGTEMDGAIAYGKPGRRTPLWLGSVIKHEMNYLHKIIKGGEVDQEFEKLLTGVAAKEAIATADACTLSREEDRKVKLSEITK
ncbi:Gfo/Idh/MocA family protein [Dolosigranulum pigrum]|uniref:Gfo/Idh/MocA family protein n=1 Tax=Dolosigranulum pigrum TaxID=29394 RepID=UPI001AD851E4|nr:Gfo/Idh/MocA family oxidoreductase [Dolosigranulum pigrum]QTJ43856.1 Gfo/Idh/MocA family oxidoreductase [Dolosigranulum pigrum]QTJ47281.1 Gfo/Idh/MocA family oxidoreductase [Dolosigranulum pigrum]QTJ60788.1 Gfo/Idh/MocA family oxidoreductase [Dolosigranulum pigrum]